MGDDLGGGVRKLRMAIKSKGKGNKEKSKMTFLYAYDKSDMSNVSDNKIRQIIADNGLSIE